MHQWMVRDLVGRQERLRHRPESGYGERAQSAAARAGGRGGDRRRGGPAGLWSASLRRGAASLLPAILGLRTLLRIWLGIPRLGMALVKSANMFSRRYG